MEKRMEKRMRKRTKTRKTNRFAKWKNNKSMRRGGCGCQKGGMVNPPSFDGGLPIRYYYPPNDHSSGGTDPSLSLSSRNLPSIVGGKKKKTNKQIKKKYRKTIRVGGGDMLLGSTYSGNPVMTFGTTFDGIDNSIRILTSSPGINPSTFVNSTGSGYSSFNPPMV